MDVRRFDNRTSAEVAQVVEHGTENAGVDSSSLSLGTTYLLIFETHAGYAVVDGLSASNGRH